MDYIKGGESIDDFLDGFPTVTREQVVAFLEESPGANRQGMCGSRVLEDTERLRGKLRVRPRATGLGLRFWKAQTDHGLLRASFLLAPPHVGSQSATEAESEPGSAIQIPYLYLR
jgi:hypothetical protein